ncbi:hypothetical protein N7494_011276 [Penicillium frequentans]|uniref:Uncharacterized protein n=1 Tax=Penicillium frequentans TaxID=3151616 RepID=A0AAD6CJX9_9EURO|nr:hypothetical protein N7494_011276 [Penicillium glabrum]
MNEPAKGLTGLARPPLNGVFYTHHDLALECFRMNLGRIKRRFGASGYIHDRLMLLNFLGLFSDELLDT